MKRILLASLFLVAMSLQAQIHYLPQDSIFFEYNTCPVYINPSPGNIWQIGTPHKTWLDMAYSPPKAIVTDTLLSYPENNTSVFSFMIDSNSIWNNPIGLATYLSFIHKFDTDTLVDYGIIEASIDGGITWCDLGDPSCFEGYLGGPAWWEPDSSLTSHNLFLHPPKISGRSDGWIFSRFHFDYAIGKMSGLEHPIDSIMIRFTFHSDATPSSREGWMIDNLIIGACDIFVPVPDHDKPNHSIDIRPNPLVDISYMKLPAGISIDDILVLDETGKVIRQFQGQGGTKIPLFRKDFSPGLYFLKAQSRDGRSFFGKFLVH